MSKETINLTKALKGDSKAQGNWGELVLERVLEKSGLQKDSEYFVQQSFLYKNIHSMTLSHRMIFLYNCKIDNNFVVTLLLFIN